MTLRARELTRLGWVVGTVVAAFACGGGSEPGGTLTISVDNYAKVTGATTLTLTGTVTRTPAKDLPLVVRATGGVGTPIDTAEGGRFSLPITLQPGATNQVKVSASDASRSTSDSVTVTIRQDNQPPTITQATPPDASDNVSLSPTILVKLSEPAVVSPGGGVRLSRQGVTIPGSSSISADSLTLTFVPSATLSPNGIYRVGFTGVADAVGNAPTTTACFVTTMTGLSPSTTATDPTGVPVDIFGTTFPAVIPVPDLIGGRFGREGTFFSAIFQFVGPRTFTGTTNRAGVLLDLDLDQDSTTGFRPLKDSVLISSGRTGTGCGGCDTLTSGTRAEYLVDVTPDPDHGDSATIWQYDGYQHGAPTARFVPGNCGAFLGFVLPWSILGADDGNVNVLASGWAENATDAYLDPMPVKGHLTLILAGPTPPIGPVADMRAAVTLVSPTPYRRRIGPRIPLAPLR